MDLSLNLRGIMSQRLVRRMDGEGRVPAVEVMINSPLMADLILQGRVHDLKELIKNSTELGMRTFDQALFDLFEAGVIDYREALRNADSVNDLRLRIKLESSRAKTNDIFEGTDKIELLDTQDDHTL